MLSVMRSFKWMAQGAIVTTVHARSPAEQLGLRSGDVIVKIDDFDVNTHTDVTKARAPDDRPATLYVWRAGEVRKVAVGPGKVGIRMSNWDIAKGGNDHSRGLTALGEKIPNRDEAYIRLRAAQKGWADWVQLLGDGKLYAAGDDLKGVPGAKETDKVKVKLDEKPTLDKMSVRVTTAGGSDSRRLEFADFSREELWSVLVSPKLDKLPGDVASGLAWLFVWLGLDDAAQPLLDRAINRWLNDADMRAFRTDGNHRIA